MPRQFQGSIQLDVRDSVQDWPAFLPDRAPKGAPKRRCARRPARCS